MRILFRYCITLTSFAFIASCTSVKNTTGTRSISSLRLLNTYIIPHALQYKETTVGGLSGIDFNNSNQEYYLICDDRSDKNPARFYTAKITINREKIDTVIFTVVTFLKMATGNDYPNAEQDPQLTPDPEAMRYNAKNNSFVWSSEGERIINNSKTILNDPSVISIRSNGSLIDTFVLPENMRMTTIDKGPRRNGTFEGMSFDDQFKNLFISVEEPIYDDGPKAGLADTAGWTRIIKYDVKKRKPVAQYAYPLDAVAHAPSPAGAFKINGVTDILFVEKNKFITIERSYSTGRLGCSVKVYLTDISAASDVSLLAIKDKPAFRSATKTLLLNMDSLGIFIDNIEGVTFGPTLPNGHKTLLFIADDNFAAYQFSQLLLFEIIP